MCKGGLDIRDKIFADCKILAMEDSAYLKMTKILATFGHSFTTWFHDFGSDDPGTIIKVCWIRKLFLGRHRFSNPTFM